jgi:hypothetical protein
VAEGPVLETRLVPQPAAAAPAARAFSAGGVVGRTLEVWWRHLLAFTILSFAVYAPLLAALVAAWVVFRRAGPGGPGMVGVGVAFAAATLLSLALAAMQAGAVTYGTVRHLGGGRARLPEMLSVGVRRGLPVVSTGFLVWLAVAGGTLLLVVPGVVLLVATCAAVPAAVVERRRAVDAFRRSLALTRGSRWPLFAAGLALVAVVAVLSTLAQVAAIAAGALLSPARAAVVTLVVTQLANAVFASIPTVGIAVAYHDLRVAKEGVDTEALAKVFE